MSSGSPTVLSPSTNPLSNIPSERFCCPSNSLADCQRICSEMQLNLIPKLYTLNSLYNVLFRNSKVQCYNEKKPQRTIRQMSIICSFALNFFVVLVPMGAMTWQHYIQNGNVKSIIIHVMRSYYSQLLLSHSLE